MAVLHNDTEFDMQAAAAVDDDTGWPTTRRHPRTMAEAFADSRAPALERPRPMDVNALGHKTAVAFCIVAGCAVIASLLAQRFA